MSIFLKLISQVTEKIENQIFCSEGKSSNDYENLVFPQQQEKTCRILQHRYYKFVLMRRNILLEMFTGISLYIGIIDNYTSYLDVCRYGGLKQSKSCYEKEGTKEMCTTINCEFQNAGRECNETITTIEV